MNDYVSCLEMIMLGHHWQTLQAGWKMTTCFHDVINGSLACAWLRYVSYLSLIMSAHQMTSFPFGWKPVTLFLSRRWICGCMPGSVDITAGCHSLVFPFFVANQAPLGSCSLFLVWVLFGGWGVILFPHGRQVITAFFLIFGRAWDVRRLRGWSAWIGTFFAFCNYASLFCSLQSREVLSSSPFTETVAFYLCCGVNRFVWGVWT